MCYLFLDEFDMMLVSKQKDIARHLDSRVKSRFGYGFGNRTEKRQILQKNVLKNPVSLERHELPKLPSSFSNPPLDGETFTRMPRFNMNQKLNDVPGYFDCFITCLSSPYFFILVIYFFMIAYSKRILVSLQFLFPLLKDNKIFSNQFQ